MSQDQIERLVKLITLQELYKFADLEVLELRKVLEKERLVDYDVKTLDHFLIFSNRANGGYATRVTIRHLEKRSKSTNETRVYTVQGLCYLDYTEAIEGKLGLRELAQKYLTGSITPTDFHYGGPYTVISFQNKENALRVKGVLENIITTVERIRKRKESH